MDCNARHAGNAEASEGKVSTEQGLEVKRPRIEGSLEVKRATRWTAGKQRRKSEDKVRAKKGRKKKIKEERVRGDREMDGWMDRKIDR